MLNAFKTAGTSFQSVQAIVDAVNRDPKVAEAMTEASELVGTLEDGVTKVTKNDIRKGKWGPIPGRINGDYELEISTGPPAFITYKVHIHPPKFPGGKVQPGEVMCERWPTRTQAAPHICEEILRIHGRPPGW